MNAIPPSVPPRYCGNCGSPAAAGCGDFCGTCGARLPAAIPAPVPPAQPPLQAVQPYPPAYPPAYPPPPYPGYYPPPRRSSAAKWLLPLGIGLVVIIALILALTPGGGGGPTEQDIAANANGYSGTANNIEILSKKSCTLTELDRDRGYTQKWYVEYRQKDDRYDWVTRGAWAFDGYTWDDYFATNSTTGCPQ